MAENKTLSSKKASAKPAKPTVKKRTTADVVQKAAAESTKDSPKALNHPKEFSEKKEVEAKLKAAVEKRPQKKIQVIQTGSSIRRDRRQYLYLKSLGLGKIGKTKELVDNNSVRSLIAKVAHMVKVVE